MTKPGTDTLKDVVGSNKGTAMEPKLPYPRSVCFIVVTEFCERFAYYGMRAVLTIYMRNVLNFSDDLSTIIYHVFLFLCYFLPLFGAILADSFLGKYRTVLALSSIFALGNLLLTLSATPPLHFPTVHVSLLGLFLMAVGTGGIKPCVVALGGDQFKVPEQEKQLKQFFSVFLFAVSVGNMLSTVLTPVLRRDVQCFGGDCYFLAFGVPTLLMVIAIGVFVFGRPMYKINKPKENIIVQVAKCMMHAVSRKRQLASQSKGAKESRKHWVDYASYEGSKFDEGLIQDTKGLLRVLVYYLPVPMFWALYEQLGSRWTLQATRMDGIIWGGFTVKPDQMQVTNAVLMFTFIPIFESIILPFFQRRNLLKRPLQRMVVGGLLAAASFGMAGYTELRIQEKSGQTLPQDYLNIVNALPYPLKVFCDNSSALATLRVGAYGNYYVYNQNCRTPTVYILPEGVNSSDSEPLVPFEQKWRFQTVVVGPGSNFSSRLTRYRAYRGDKQDDLIKSKQGNAKLTIHNLITEPISNASPVLTHQRGEKYVLGHGRYALQMEVTPGKYRLSLNRRTNMNFVTPDLTFHTGGNYLLVLTSAAGSIKAQDFILVEPNRINILWQLPQYILMAWAEILFIISGMEFSFTEAPVSMKSVLQSCWHLANATGNVMVIVATKIKGGLSQSHEFLIFALLMVVDACIMALMARRYKYVGTTDHDDDDSVKRREDSVAKVKVEEGEESTAHDTRL